MYQRSSKLAGACKAKHIGKIKIKDGNQLKKKVESSIRITKHFLRQFFFFNSAISKVNRLDSFCMSITENGNSYLSFLPNPKRAPK
jgi:hypothetical protein